MSKINDLLQDKHDEFLNHQRVFEKYPWIYSRDQNCIISPDSDGFMCALLMSHYLDWNIKGFYDGKILLYDKDIDLKQAIFLDIEIFNKNIRSVGQHCIIPHNQTYQNLNLDGFESCISPGMLRGYDAWKEFRLKFPFATIHFLISLLSKKIDINLKPTALSSLLFVDGMFNVIFSYPENSLNWFNYLKFNDDSNPLKHFFFEKSNSLEHVMSLMDDFFKKRNNFGGKGRSDRGDHLIISDKNSNPSNLNKLNDYYHVDLDWVDRMKGFIKMNAENLGWKFYDKKWSWGNFKLESFEKRLLGGDNPKASYDGKTFAIKNMEWYYSQGIVSNAVTAGNRIEYSVYKNNNHIFE